MQCVPLATDFGVRTGIPARLEEGERGRWSAEKMKLSFDDRHGKLKQWAERDSEGSVRYDDGRWFPHLSSADAVFDALRLLGFWSSLDVREERRGKLGALYTFILP